MNLVGLSQGIMWTHFGVDNSSSNLDSVVYFGGPSKRKSSIVEVRMRFQPQGNWTRQRLKCERMDKNTKRGAK